VGSQRWRTAVLTRNTVGATPSEQHERGFGDAESEDVERVRAVDTGAAGGKSSQQPTALPPWTTCWPLGAGRVEGKGAGVGEPSGGGGWDERKTGVVAMALYASAARVRAVVLASGPLDGTTGVVAFIQAGSWWSSQESSRKERRGWCGHDLGPVRKSWRKQRGRRCS
jgi:hypothetical protein